MISLHHHVLISIKLQQLVPRLMIGNELPQITCNANIVNSKVFIGLAISE